MTRYARKLRKFGSAARLMEIKAETHDQVPPISNELNKRQNERTTNTTDSTDIHDNGISKIETMTPRP